jgi:hypothetical protein
MKRERERERERERDKDRDRGLAGPASSAVLYEGLVSVTEKAALDIMPCSAFN